MDQACLAGAARGMLCADQTNVPLRTSDISRSAPGATPTSTSSSSVSSRKPTRSSASRAGPRWRRLRQRLPAKILCVSPDTLHQRTQALTIHPLLLLPIQLLIHCPPRHDTEVHKNPQTQRDPPKRPQPRDVVRLRFVRRERPVNDVRGVVREGVYAAADPGVERDLEEGDRGRPEVDGERDLEWRC